MAKYVLKSDRQQQAEVINPAEEIGDIHFRTSRGQERLPVKKFLELYEPLLPQVRPSAIPDVKVEALGTPPEPSGPATPATPAAATKTADIFGLPVTKDDLEELWRKICHIWDELRTAREHLSERIRAAHAEISDTHKLVKDLANTVNEVAPPKKTDSGT